MGNPLGRFDPLDPHEPHIDALGNPDAAQLKGIAEAANQVGIYGKSQRGAGVWGQSDSGVGIRGQGSTWAGFFEGNVHVTGKLTIPRADFAEDFNVLHSEHIEPGAVLVLSDEESLQLSSQAYDKRVAGVVSGAGDYSPGIVLDSQGMGNNRIPIALMGKVYCKVDAQYGPVEVGDLLTTSPNPGHAMKVGDPLQAFGAVIGKAMQPLREGQGLIPILIALQ